MRRALTWTVLALCGVQAGCHKPAVREKPLPDPLLTSKKPVQGNPHLSEPAGREEEVPPPPPMPLSRRERVPEGSVVQMLGRPS